MGWVDPPPKLPPATARFRHSRCNNLAQNGIDDRNTPSCLPKKRPRMTPRGMGAASLAGDMPASDTPAFANAKTGTIA
jgi:hypothetical protein